MFDSDQRREAVDRLLAEHRELTARLSDPAVHQDPALARRLNRRFAELGAVVTAHRAWSAAAEELADARELAAAGDDDAAAFAAEVPGLEAAEAEAAERLRRLLIPRDPDDARDVILEIKGGEGGVHRVQRVPVTESQGRIHTSAAGVLVLPEVDAPDEVHLDPNDLKVDVFRSSGPGGQSVNTTDSAVRLTHLPTGIVVSMQNEKSQIQNREAALRVLRSRLLERQRAEQDAENSAARAAQVRTMDRSERIRTYNFPENRIADHRTGYKAHNLDAVLDGDLEAVIASCLALDEERRLAALGGDA